MIDAFGVERSEISKVSANVARQLARMAGTEGQAGLYAQTRLAAHVAGKEAAKARKFAVNSSGQATIAPSAVGRVQRESSRAALSNVAKEPRAGSVASTETAAANAIKNNRTRSQKVLQAVGSGSRAVGTRVRAVSSRVGSGTVRATRAVGSGTARAGRSLRGAMTRTPKPAAVTPAAATPTTAPAAATPTTAAAKAPAAATGTEAGTATVKNKSRFKRNAALVGGGAAIGAGGMAYSTNRRNQTMSKSAFGVDHEVSKAEEKKASWRRYGSAAAVGPLHGAFAGKKGRKTGATAREYVGWQLGGAAGTAAGMAGAAAVQGRAAKNAREAAKGHPLSPQSVLEALGDENRRRRIMAGSSKKRTLATALLVGGGAAGGHYGGQALGVRSAQKAGAYKPEPVRKSAFGVTHEVSKLSPLIGTQMAHVGAEAQKVLKPVKATTEAFKGARNAKTGFAGSVGAAGGTFMRKAPKTSIAIGAGAGAAGGAGIGYAANKNNR